MSFVGHPGPKEGSFTQGPYILGSSRVGADTLIAGDVIIGHPGKTSLIETRDFSASSGATVGDRCILRSGTVIYERSVLGNDVQTAHHVVVRENTRIGDGCVLGNGAVIREGAILGRNVRLMEHVVISEDADLGEDIFIGPGVVFTAGRYMTAALEASGQLSREGAAELEGKNWKGPSVIVDHDARIGANAVILAGVRLGAGCVVAAGALVSINVPAGALIAGNPGRILKTRQGG